MPSIYVNSLGETVPSIYVDSDTDPTASPTLSPTYLGAPEYKKQLNGLAPTRVIAILLFFLGALWRKYSNSNLINFSPGLVRCLTNFSPRLVR